MNSFIGHLIKDFYRLFYRERERKRENIEGGYFIYIEEKMVKSEKSRYKSILLINI